MAEDVTGEFAMEGKKMNRNQSSRAFWRKKDLSRRRRRVSEIMN